MPLVVEDGTVVSGANSYIDLPFLIMFASDRGFELPVLDEDKEELAIVAIDYLEHYRSRYQGLKVDGDQPLQWPRTPVTIDGFVFPSNEIPIELKNAQAQLVVEQHLGIPLYPLPSSYTSTSSSVAGDIIQETVGPLTIKYSSGGSSSTAASSGTLSTTKPSIIASVESFLLPLFGGGGSSAPLTCRV